MHSTPYYTLPQVRIYVHGPGMKELMDAFDEIQPITLRYDDSVHDINVVSIEKRSKVNTLKAPCVVREENPDYDPNMVCAMLATVISSIQL